jgi:hypothetical protein
MSLQKGKVREGESQKALRSRHRHHRQPTNFVALVRERTIPTERPPPVGEVSTNFYG